MPRSGNTPRTTSLSLERMNSTEHYVNIFDTDTPSKSVGCGRPIQRSPTLMRRSRRELSRFGSGIGQTGTGTYTIRIFLHSERSSTGRGHGEYRREADALAQGPQILIFGLRSAAMALKGTLVVALALFSLGKAQYGPLKGSSSGRTTTPFPPGFHSDNQLYNSDSNQIGPSGGQKTPAGAASYSDNPWLSGIISQNSGPGPSYQQTKPTQPCNVPEHVCVPRHQCQGGQTTSPGSGVSTKIHYS